MQDRNNHKLTSPFSPVVLDVHLGIELFNVIIEKHGVAGWNRWKQSMTQMNPNPLVHSGETAGSPPVFLIWLDFHGADLTGRDLDGIDFADCYLSGVNFRGSSFVSANFDFCFVTGACFIDTDLRNSEFQGAIVDGVNFSGAKLDGVCFDGAMYELTPPIGLPPHLATHLHQCANAIGDWQLTRIVSWDVPTTLVPARVEVAFDPMGCRV